MKPKSIIRVATLDRAAPDSDTRFAFATLLLVLTVTQLAGFHVLGSHMLGIVSP